jgi:uncharacterized membrane protein
VNTRLLLQPESERRVASLGGALVFFAGIIFTALLTFAGLHAFVQQVTAADGVRSGLVTVVLSLGLVLVGPALLWALTVIWPRWWFRSVKDQMKALLRKSDDSRRRPGPR